jgi:hypothetical protein
LDSPFAGLDNLLELLVSPTGFDGHRPEEATNPAKGDHKCTIPTVVSHRPSPYVIKNRLPAARVGWLSSVTTSCFAVGVALPPAS